MSEARIGEGVEYGGREERECEKSKKKELIHASKCV